MTEHSNNTLVLEILRGIRGDLAEIKGTLADHGRQLLRLREDVNNLRGDDLRREGMQAQMAVRLERIETRLSLSDS